ncbi:MAG: PH domain-containing protein [Candidatus Gracilibacteria bacterium]|jgi:hypothetical protein
MHLREGEEILKTYRHHPTPFAFSVIKVVLSFAPFYLFVFFSNKFLPGDWYVILHLALFVLFAIVILYITLVYWLDKLVITNQRVIYINYIFLTVSEESQAFIGDVQDIITNEKGLLSYFRIFDYGTIRMETSASSVTILFDNAPDPESIRQYIFHIRKQ